MSDVALLLSLLARPGWAASDDLIEEYETRFAATVAGDPTLPALAFWRARVALWAILRSVLEEPGDVLVPAFTCDMVPAAIQFAGGRCVYVDVEAGTYLSSPRQVARARTPRTRAVLCQHTYGLRADVRGFISAAGDAMVVEDRCQLVGGEPGDAQGAAAFYSSQWNKPYSTGLGGMAVFRDRALFERVKLIRAGFSHAADRSRSRSLALQQLLHHLTVRPSTRGAITRAYRWAQRSGWVRGTTTAEEYQCSMPGDYAARATNVQAATGLARLGQWQANLEHRRRLTDFYLDRLPRLGVGIAALGAGDHAALWTVPVLVENKSDVLARAGRAGLPISTWFDRIPAHVAAATAARYDYAPGQCPESERRFTREVHLLTAPSVDLTQAERALELLAKHARFSPF
jgi:dTDP-4-amino-4,6-dideoxygalactose transaminase